MSPQADLGEEKFTPLQRVILPDTTQMDTVPLYVDTGSAIGLAVPTIPGAPKTDRPQPRMAAPSREAHAEDFLSRISTKVRPGERMSFGTYFNAFAASYWRRWTTVDSVQLRVRTSGRGTVIVYKSNARGSLQRVDTRRVSTEETSVFELSLAPFGDGGWYWFDLVGGAEPLILEEAVWGTLAPAPEFGTVTVQITTLNKPDYCLNNLRLLASNPETLSNVQEVLLVDQGSQKVQDFDGFSEVAEELGGKLRIINQANLGGSGGFARGMYEAVENGSDYALLMDDDIVVEPESISRLLTFAAFCRRPTLVGGHMFDLYNRTVLHTFGEIVNPYRFQPDQPHADMEMGHDFMSGNLRQTPWMHRRIDVDYNGWWMCLIPTSVIREIGLSLPVFIKWDDAEYGLRAKAHGYATVSLPGSAVWHVSWADKDDLVGWQAYFHARNRFIAALLHSPYDLGGRVLKESQFADVKHIVSMQYATVEGRQWALDDVLGGPDGIAPLLSTKLPQIREMMAGHEDSVIKGDPEAFPAPRMAKHPVLSGKPNMITLLPWTARTVFRQLFVPVTDMSKEYPQTKIAHQDNKWWTVSQYDSAVVSNAEGTGASWYRRNPAQVRNYLAASARRHGELVSKWKSLRDEYRAALPGMTSMESWKAIFDEFTEPDGR
ncbi:MULTISPECIES: glycosyltransferase [Arthrobacter]|uniref:Glycosyltransferase n=2 Tax=Arthrobacter TaxID=1663 RepID=A0ABU9KKL1_9MICC|nr:glycosyltransferase [Arthrobacter sp. YJM1]MDP5227232.1 glycosyltransferase [Arthrobacter sp. YJM1]